MNLNRISFLGSAVALAVVAMLLPAGEASAEPRHEKEESHAGAPALSPVVVPEVPASVTFAGEEVSLDPVNMWERLDRELSAMSYSHGNTLLAIKRANRYFPVLAPILKRNNIPMDMLYLAAIESTMNPKAVSPAKAAGLWQFMPSTAQEYGTEVNDAGGER